MAYRPQYLPGMFPRYPEPDPKPVLSEQQKADIAAARFHVCAPCQFIGTCSKANDGKPSDILECSTVKKFLQHGQRGGGPHE